MAKALKGLPGDRRRGLPSRAGGLRNRPVGRKIPGNWMGGAVPIGYDPEGRTLKINKVEAGTVRTLYDLCEQHGSIRAVREEAERLGLRTRRRESATDNVSGGEIFDRGHIGTVRYSVCWAYCRH